MARRQRLAWMIFAAAGCCGLGLQGLAAGPAAAAPGLPGGAVVAGAPLTVGSETRAMARAASSGLPAEVMADRTDWQQVFAEPGGGFLAKESPVPVRVQQGDGSWAPVDATLSVRADGLVAPGAVVPGLLLSGGGSGPLFTVSQATGDPAGSVSVSWPYGPLPAPSLSGATATYSGVLPGVNLLVTAQPMGVDAVLQVTSAAAAADPRLATISFPLSAPGLNVALDGLGGVTMRDGAGDALFAEPPAQMWDSAGLAAAGGSAPAGAGAVPTGLTGPVPGDHMGVAAVSAGAGSVSLSPVASVLSGPSVVYPVYIDPAITYSKNQAGWLDVGHDFTGYNSSNNGGPCKSQGGSWNCWGDWEYTDPAGGIRAGVWCNGPQFPPAPPPPSNICYDSYPDSTWGAYRSYLNFNLPSALAGAAYVDATLSVYNVWSYNCSNGSSLELWETGEATSSMAWNSKPGEQTWQDSSTRSYGNTCNPAGITLNATSAVQDTMNNGKVTLELRASLSSENARPPDLTNWRRFLATGTTCGFPGSSTPCLQVFWMHKPNQATAPATEGTFSAQTGQTVTGCATGQASPDYVSTATPRLDASVTDPDVTATSDPLTSFKGRIGWKDMTSNTTGQDFGSGDVSSSTSTFWDQVPSGDFVDGHEYQWQAYGEAKAQDAISGNTVTEDGTRSSPCYVTVDLAPSNGTDMTGTVGVTSNVYVSGTTSGRIGEPGTFTFTDPAYSGADSDLAGYFYGIDNSPPSQYVQAGTGGTATITITPYINAEEDLYVQAVDGAGLRGPLATSNGTVVPSFEIMPGTTSANIATMAYWRLNGGGSDASGNGADVSLSSGPSYPCASSVTTPGPPYRCRLTGEADANRPVVSPQAGFTVSAWVSTSGCGTTVCVAMSEDDAPTSPQVSAFTLGYQGSGTAGGVTCPCWLFSQPSSDVSGATVDKAAAGTSAPSGGWVQLTGVFDPLQIVGSQRGTLTLYVNGAQAGQFAGISIWSNAPTGMLRLGAGLNGSGPWSSGGTTNLVSDACVFYGALGASDIATLYDGGTADGCSVLATEYENPPS